MTPEAQACINLLAVFLLFRLEDLMDYLKRKFEVAQTKEEA